MMDPKYNNSNIDGFSCSIDVHSLSNQLRSGDLTITAVISHTCSILKDVLRVIAEYAEDESKASLERKTKIDRMDKIINDLSEKCQGMQQELLYKEEKYDEKCREVERYKVICELSINSAYNDKPYYKNRDGVDHNNNNNNDGLNRGVYHSAEMHDMDSVAKSVKLENQYCVQPVQDENGTRTLRHLKVNPSQFGKPVEPKNQNIHIDFLSSSSRNDRRSLACDYAGGPSSRRSSIVSNNGRYLNSDMKIRDRLETIGAINVRGPHIESGPVDSARLSRAINPVVDDQNKRVKISLSGQTNEILSSSGDSVHRLRQKVVEKDHYKHIPGGFWAKLPSRRKKEWPF